MKISYLLVLLLSIMYMVASQAPKDSKDSKDSKDGKEDNRNEADILNDIKLRSFEHYDYLDILYKLKGHNEDTYILFFYVDEDHHKEHRDNIKRLIFKDNPDFVYVEANVSKPNYAPIKKAIRFPQNTKKSDFPMIMVMKKEVGKMAYGPGVAKKAADIVDAMKKAEEAAKKKAEADKKKKEAEATKK